MRRDGVATRGKILDAAESLVLERALLARYAERDERGSIARRASVRRS